MLLCALLSAGAATATALGDLGLLPADDSAPAFPFVSHPDSADGSPSKWSGSWTRDASIYSSSFACPSGGERRLLGDPVVCPAYVLDTHDAMSQPLLAIDPENPSLMAFSALHGGKRPADGLAEPPSIRSRSNEVHQPHTTFRTLDGGNSWEDMPYYAPDPLLEEGREIYGEDNTIALDAEGRVVLASLYAHRAAADPFAVDESSYEFAVGVWKSHRIQAPVDYEANLLVLRSGNDGLNPIRDLRTLFVPDANRVLVLWLETNVTASDNASALRAFWSEPGTGAVWNELTVEPPVGPCRALSDAVPRGGDVVVGCQPGDGYTFPEGSEDGLQLHAVNATSGASRHLASAALAGDAVRIVARGPYGHLVAASATLDEQGSPHLWIAYGDAEERWSDARDLIDDVPLPDAARVTDVRATAMAFRPSSGTVHLILLTRYQPDAGAGAAAPSTEYLHHKALVIVRGEGPVEQALDLGIGRQAMGDAASTTPNTDLDTYDDLHDGIAVWRDPDGGDREFVAYGDHGYVRFAEVVEEGFAPPPILVGPQVAPIPLATAGANPLVYGAAAGVLSLAMVARVLAARSKKSTEVEVKL